MHLQVSKQVLKLNNLHTGQFADRKIKDINFNGDVKTTKSYKNTQ